MDEAKVEISPSLGRFWVRCSVIVIFGLKLVRLTQRESASMWKRTMDVAFNKLHQSDILIVMPNVSKRSIVKSCCRVGGNFIQASVAGQRDADLTLASGALVKVGRKIREAFTAIPDCRSVRQGIEQKGSVLAYCLPLQGSHLALKGTVGLRLSLAAAIPADPRGVAHPQPQANPTHSSPACACAPACR